MEEKNKNVLKICIIALVIIILIVGGYFGYKELTKEKPIDNKKDEVKEKITPLLYEVTKEGSTNKMYLLGSIHTVFKDDLDRLPDYVLNAYKNSHYLACEYDSIAYNKDTEKVLSDAMKMLYQDDTTIKDHLSEKVYNKIIDFLKKKNSYINVYENYKLYFFVSLFSAITAQDANMSITSGVDDYFLDKAYKDKKTILEVESYDFQVGIFDETPDIAYELMLDYSIDHYDESVIELKKLYESWKNGDEKGLLDNGSEDAEILDSYTAEQKKYLEDFNKKLIDNRNDSMTKKVIEYFNNNQDVFFMVGALHIIGDTGVANQLKNQGFNVQLVK